MKKIYSFVKFANFVYIESRAVFIYNVNVNDDNVFTKSIFYIIDIWPAR
jgi:hypothetical protein